jgi:hypothetical protein
LVNPWKYSHATLPTIVPFGSVNEILLLEEGVFMEHKTGKEFKKITRTSNNLKAIL